MSIDLKPLTEEERYIVWCERIRLLFQKPISYDDCYRTDPYERLYSEKSMSSDEDSFSKASLHSSSGTRDDVENVGNSTNKDVSSCVGSSTPTKYYDQDIYPFCFYMRMLQTASGVGSSRRPCDGRSEMDAFNTEDEVAERLAVKLRNAAAQTRRQKADEARRKDSEWRDVVNKYDRRGQDPIPCRDPSLEAMLSAMHDDMTELLLYAQKKNRASHELKSQLAHSKLLLLRYSTPNEEDSLTVENDG